MHWTALLAYRRFPADARVIDDLPCIQCGYNLRGIGARGRCPECGADIGNSLFVLARPHDVARALRTAGFSYYAMLAPLIGCLTNALGALLLAAIIILAGATFRAWAVNDLRRRGKIDKLPVIGERLFFWWLASLVDFALSAAWVGAILWAAQSTAVNASRAVTATIAAWFGGVLISAFSGGRLGHGLAEMIGYGWAALELRIQQGALALCAVLLAAALAVRTAAPGSRVTWLIVGGCLGLAVVATFALTAIALTHVGNAAEHADDTWDEVIGYDDAQTPPPHAAARPAEPPPISLEP